VIIIISKLVKYEIFKHFNNNINYSNTNINNNIQVYKLTYYLNHFIVIKIYRLLL